MRRNTILQLSTLFLALWMLNGCAILTTQVSAIGVRETFGRLPLDAPSGQVDLNDVGMNGIGGPCMAYMPYKTFSRDSHPVPLGHFPFEIVKRPSSPYSMDGEVRVNLGAGETAFQTWIPSETKEYYLINHRYRRWYGYPAQALQLVAVPTDIVLNLTTVAIVVVIMPIEVISKHWSRPKTHAPANGQPKT